MFRERLHIGFARISQQTLSLAFVDLLLVHWPQPNVRQEETLGALAKAL